jgi:hypothetical protein
LKEEAFSLEAFRENRTPIAFFSCKKIFIRFLQKVLNFYHSLLQIIFPRYQKDLHYFHKKTNRQITMAEEKKSSKLIIIPGNGCSDIRNSNWYQWLADNLKSDYKNTANNLEIICETMPDPYTARAKYWIPFIKSKLDSAENVYVVGHSSGAVAILRLCEELGQDIDAAFVVSACATHLGDDNEKASGKSL